MANESASDSLEKAEARLILSKIDFLAEALRITRLFIAENSRKCASLEEAEARLRKAYALIDLWKNACLKVVNGEKPPFGRFEAKLNGKSRGDGAGPRGKAKRGGGGGSRVGGNTRARKGSHSTEEVVADIYDDGDDVKPRVSNIDGDNGGVLFGVDDDDDVKIEFGRPGGTSAVKNDDFDVERFEIKEESSSNDPKNSKETINEWKTDKAGPKRKKCRIVEKKFSSEELKNMLDPADRGFADVNYHSVIRTMKKRKKKTDETKTNINESQSIETRCRKPKRCAERGGNDDDNNINNDDDGSPSRSRKKVIHRCRLCQMPISIHLYNHMSLVHGSPEYDEACPLCLDTRVDDIIFHLNTKHFKKTPFHCDTCPAVQYSFEDLQKHKRKHTIDKRFRCDQCKPKVWFENESTLKEHEEKLHHYPATEGGEAALAAAAITTSSPPERFDFVCFICGMTIVSFKNRNNLQNKIRAHNRNHHDIRMRKKDDEDDDEDLRISTRESFSAADNEKIITYDGECDVCGKVYRSDQSREILKNKIKAHKRTFHDPKRHHCRICKMSFPTNCRLTKHFARHADARPYICTYANCDKRFKSTSNLNQHKAFHEPPKFICDLCSGGFYFSHTLKNHKLKCEG